MSAPTQISYPLCNLLHTDVEGFGSLVESALHMRWHLTFDASHEEPEDVFTEAQQPFWEVPTFGLSSLSGTPLLAQTAIQDPTA